MENERYYMIGGGGGPPAAHNSYSMWTLRSEGDDVAGPYAPDPDAYRLSGQERGATANFGQALAACVSLLHFLEFFNRLKRMCPTFLSKTKK
jgi:hypothetical protein